MFHISSSVRRLAVFGASVLLFSTLQSAPISGQSAAKGGGSGSGPARPPVKGRVLALGDFHGALEPPTGSSGRFVLPDGSTVDAGGAGYLATHLQQLRAASEAAGEQVLTAAAGDTVGRSPLLSTVLNGEPAVAALSALGLDLSAIAHGELAKGLTELRRLQRGGCHPVDGCTSGPAFDGARFRFLSANLVDARTKLPVFLPFELRLVGGVPVAVVGITPRSTAALLPADAMQGLQVLDEAATANTYAAALRLLGVRAMIMLIHEGGQQQPVSADASGCTGFTGPVGSLVARLRPEYGIVITGHTHAAYACALPNAAGTPSLVTGASDSGKMITSIGFTLDPRTKQFVSATAQNLVVTRTVTPDAGVTQLVNDYRIVASAAAARPVGTITADLSRVPLPSGESALGDVIADGMLAATRSTGAQIAFMNSGGIRADLVYASSPAGEGPGVVTYGEAFPVLPFSERLTTITLTGAQIDAVLEQQFAGYNGQVANRFLQVSSGFSYTQRPANPPGDRVSDVRLDGVPIFETTTYRATVPAFLATGGDGFSGFTAGTNAVPAPLGDFETLVAYLTANPNLAPPPANRVSVEF